MTRENNVSVLIVEDERLVALDLRETLSELGYEVSGIASSSAEAIARASERCPDVVLMDIRIKGERDGIETAQLLTSRFDVALVYLTAHADDVTIARATATEPHGYLLKPVRAGALRSAIEVAVYRQRLERRLRASERWFSTTLRSIADAVVTTNMTGNVTFMNPAAEALTGRTAEQALGRPAREVLRLSDVRPPLEEATPIDDALRSNRTVYIKHARILNLQTGTESMIDDSAAPVVCDGQTLGVVMVFRDVTERTRLQQQVELSDRMASLGTLAAGVAHEVNNPLAVITGNAFLLRAELARLGSAQEPSRLQASLGMIEDLATAAERIGRIIADLSSFSRPRPTDDSRVVQLGPCIEWAIRTTAHELRQRAELVTEFAAVPPVRADDARLGQVFINLLMNAAQAIAPGSADRNRVTIVTRTDTRGWAVIEVRDTGSGMSPEIRKHIFDPFFTTKRLGEGTGLGLSICRGIVSALGGEIDAESEPGKGTCFRVALPPAALIERRPTPSSQRPSSGRQGRILAIDDEPMVLNVLARILLPHHVTCVDNASLALQLIEDGARFDLILCDLMMPITTGMAFYETVLARVPELAARIVFLTGGVISPDVDAFLRAVSNRCLTKPFSMEKLRELIEEFLAEPGPPPPS